MVSKIVSYLTDYGIIAFSPFQDSNLMTFNLIVIVVFFLIGEIPGHFLSKKAAAVMLFGGDENATFEKAFQTSRKVATVLAALNISINFLLYFAMHPPFRNGLRELICGAKTDTATNESKQTSETKLSDKCEPEKEFKIDVFVISNELEEQIVDEKLKFIGKVMSWKNLIWNSFI